MSGLWYDICFLIIFVYALFVLKSIREHIVEIFFKLNSIDFNINKIQNTPAPSPSEEGTKSLPPANRRPRTDEERKRAAEIKRQWWEKKRAQELTGAPSQARPPVSQNEQQQTSGTSP